ncbi:hypothetical protein LIER_17895 [Lithospermum erythrorhizon]|uniref:Uncharacterized protein n=1 Tax=Lithospermum erythrorhizon TaxID=34254 RepID=A0AAV3QC47_LITER
MDGLRENAPIWGVVVRPTIIDVVNDPVMAEIVTSSVRDSDMEDVEGMDCVVDSCVETTDLPERSAPTIGKEAIKKEVDVPEKEVPPVVQPTVFDELLPEHGPRGEDVAQKSDDEDVAAMMKRRMKAKGKLRMNENRIIVGNKRVPKNVDAVFTANVALNSEEEKAKWSPKFMQGTYVANIPLQYEDASGTSRGGNEEIARFLRDEIRHLDGVIQTSLVRKSVLEAQLKSLIGEAHLGVDGSRAEAPHN